MDITPSADHKIRTLTLLSVIVPCFNEDAVILETHRSLAATLENIAKGSFELIYYIDDGSRDTTLSILRKLQHEDRRVRVIALSRNFGHQIAVTAGLEHASDDAVVVIDADLQDPPEVILEMFDRWRQGVNVAYGVRSEREGETAFKLWTAKAFYRFINRLSDVAIPLDTGDFCLMDRKVVNALLAMPERDRFVRGMVAWVGYRQEPRTTYGGRHIVYLSKYLPETDLLYQMSDTEVVNFTLDHLARMFPELERHWVLDAHVWRAQYSQPIVEHQYSRLIPPNKTPLASLYIATMAQIYPEDRGTKLCDTRGACTGCADCRHARAIASHLIARKNASTQSRQSLQ